MVSFDVVTMGSATQDVFARTDADTLTFRHDGEDEKMLAYPLGTKILIEELEFQIGGGGTNTACTFARQGLKTGWAGKVGKDVAGREVKQWLKDEGIAFLGSEGGQTGYSVILDSEEDDRTALAFKGANNNLSIDDVKEEAFDTRWLYSSSLLKESYETLLVVMREVKTRGGQVAFNPSSYQAKLGLGTLQKALDHVDVLILNKEEACLLVGYHCTDVKELCTILYAAGPHTVIITDGANGSTLFDGEYLEQRPTPDVTIRETTGAGDAFASGFVAGLARGLSKKDALRLGTLNAEHVIAAYGAKNDILTKDEADQLLASDSRLPEKMLK